MLGVGWDIKAQAEQSRPIDFPLRGGSGDVRDRNRRMVAEAKSHRASPEDLREAKQRIKEIEEELQQIELQDETKRGEDREQRYERMVRLREMREDFLNTVAAQEPARPNSILLALVMVVASFMLCAFCAVSGFAGLSLINQKPDPTTTATNFWTAVESQKYDTVETVLLSPTLRVQLPYDTLVAQANEADTLYGEVTNATFVSQSGNQTTNTNITYSVTRENSQGKKVVYKAIIAMVLFNRTWVISDLGTALDPHAANVPLPPGATLTPVASPSPSTTPSP